MSPQKGNRLDTVLAHILARRQSRNQLRSLTTVLQGTIDFSFNSYLSLSSQPGVQQAFLSRLHASCNPGTQLLGSGGSRLLDDNSPLAESLERTIVAFHRAPAGLLFNSAMDANVGLFACVPQPGDVIVYDELVHASVHDGIRLSRAGRRVPFAHSQVWGGSGERDSSAGVSLEAVLQSILQGSKAALFKSGTRNVDEACF